MSGTKLELARQGDLVELYYREIEEALGWPVAHNLIAKEWRPIEEMVVEIPDGKVWQLSVDGRYDFISIKSGGNRAAGSYHRHGETAIYNVFPSAGDRTTIYSQEKQEITLQGNLR